MAKKVFLFIFLSITTIFILNCNCFAMTEEELTTFMDKVFELDLVKNNYSRTSEQYVDTIVNNFDISNYDYIYVSPRNFSYSNRSLFFFFDDVPIHGAFSGSLYWKAGQNGTGGYQFSINDATLEMNSPFLRSYNPSSSSNVSSGVQFLSTWNICTNYFVYDANWLDETLYTYNNFENKNTITLISQSGKKFSFNDKNQLQVYLNGYDIGDFRFYVQKLIDGDWNTYTDVNDFYILSNYSNPYYVLWQNLNYFPVGTYRYMAIDTNNNYFYSDAFEILGNTVIVDGNVSGTVGDNNINVDVDIDAGNITDDIKDYLGGEPNTSEDEFSNSFPNVDIEDPSEDFFTWIFENIEQVFLSTDEQEFEFSLYTENSYVVSTEQIKVPDSAIKTLVGLSIDFGICYWILKDVRKTINKVKEGNIEALATEDITANMV